MINMFICRLKKKGFTLPELLIAIAVLAITTGGILSLFISCILLNETNRNTMLAYTAIQSKMEEIKNQPFDNIATYDGQVFDLSGFPAEAGKGRVSVTTIPSTQNNRLSIKIDACFKIRNRQIGDDINNCQYSPVELMTEISR